MAEAAKRYDYIVGYLAPSYTNEPGEEPLAGPDGLVILGTYAAATPLKAVETALEDPRFGGLPDPSKARMVAVVKSRWYEFGAVGEQRTVWSVAPVGEAGQTTLEAPSLGDGGGIAP